MRKSAWYMTFLSAAALAVTVGCDDPVDPCAPGSGLICPTDDGGVADADVPVDAGDRADRADTGMLTCGDVGRTGGLCRMGVCFTGLQCITEYANMAGGQLTVRDLGIGQAVAEDPADPEPSTFSSVTTPVPANDVPLTYANGSLCTEQCNTAADADTCGSCSSCSQQIGNDIGFGIFPFIPAAMRMFGTDTGLCRPHCTFEAEGNGVGCPDGYTCDGFTNTCFEACRTDANCQAALVITEEGEYGTYLVPDTGRTCNVTTGRCDWAGPATAAVGAVCDGQADCATDVGICLRGGTCAETQCTGAPSVCGEGGSGVCLATRDGANPGTVCIDGCNTAEDCNPGNGCLPLGGTLGTHTGYCLGLCDTVPSGGDDQIIACRSDERCDMPAATADDMDPDGTCRPSCDPAATVSECETDEICEAVTGQTYGFCRALNGFCIEPGTEDCVNGQICDGEIGAATFGRCVDPCTADTDCTVGAATTCVTDDTNALVGLCVETCTTSTECNAPGVTTRVCRIPVGTTDGFCVEAPAAP